jgi:cell division protein FtsZ
MIQAEAHEDANIIFGTVVDETMGDEIRITVIATGFETAEYAAKEKSVASFSGIRRISNIAVPTFIRNEKSSDPAGALNLEKTEDEGHPDLEIPTFLRRQAD